MWDVELERRLRSKYALPVAESTGAGSFVAEISGKVMFAAPATTFNAAAELPPELAASWIEQSQSNPYFRWVQGRFVEAEQANLNGAMWTTGDLQFGEMGVKHGPLNWLHQARKVIGTIADAQLIQPKPAMVTSISTSGLVGNFATTTTTTQPAMPQPRPYIAAVASMWDWIYPDEIAVVERASHDQNLFFSMECVSEKIQCVGDNGCNQEFDFIDAMSGKACTHINERASTRRLIKPSFLGGAVIVPPARPGWPGANATVMAEAARIAESTQESLPDGMTASQWEALMGLVVASARNERLS